MYNEIEHMNEYTVAVSNRHKVLCILHSFADVAEHLNHRAIHLPLPLLQSHYKDLAAFSIVGTSVHSLEEAQEAQRYGAHYIVAGHIYATDCKKGAAPKGLEFLSEICAQVEIPVYAIGGITLDKGQMAELLNCGARGGFIMSEMMKL